MAGYLSKTEKEKITKAKQVINKLVEIAFSRPDRDIHYPSDVKELVPRDQSPEKVFSNTVSILGDNEQRDCINIIIDDGVEEISAKAFESCELIGTLYVPNSVKKIGENAFIGCRNLVEITWGDSPHLEEIGQSAFSITGISCFEFPSSVTKIMSKVLEGCPNLETVIFPESITEIPSRICMDCPNLSNVEIKGKIRKIGGHAFRNCSLANFPFSDTLSEVGVACFMGNSLSELDLSNTHVAIIPQMAFMRNMISSIKLPPWTAVIGDCSFAENCLTDDEIECTRHKIICLSPTSFDRQDV